MLILGGKNKYIVIRSSYYHWSTNIHRLGSGLAVVSIRTFLPNPKDGKVVFLSVLSEGIIL